MLKSIMLLVCVLLFSTSCAHINSQPKNEPTALLMNSMNDENHTDNSESVHSPDIFVTQDNDVDSVRERYEEGELITLSGTVYEVEWFHDGRDVIFKATILTLDGAADFILYSVFDDTKVLIENVTEAHITTIDNDISLSSFANKSVIVTGTIYMAHTIYHQRDVMFVVEVVNVK